MTAAVLAMVALLSVAAPGPALRNCAGCHPAQAKPHPASAMAQALESAGSGAILQSHRSLAFRSGNVGYRIERSGSESTYTVTDGQQTLSAPLLWSFGVGSLGQTYVYSWGGQLYQARVSFYRALDGLDFTMGARNNRPKDLSEAAGLRMSTDDQVQCFSCHATHAGQGRNPDLQHMTPGVQCERCHGETANHLAGLQSGNAAQAHMTSLRSLNAEGQLNFCGGCHRTWDQIASSPGLGKLNVRFQPYRLTNSKCYDVDDRRIACTACHDPHSPLSHDAAAYDRQCQACHTGGKPTAHACKVAATGCSGCHMPKVEIPDAHHSFTDHQIRIVRANAPYPE